MTDSIDLAAWLRSVCSDYSFDLLGVYQERGDHDWPVTVANAAQLRQLVVDGGHILPLPKEPASLANVLEVSVADFVAERAREVGAITTVRGTERGYPDLEFTGPALAGEFHAVDIKVARRKPTARGVSKNTQSRITLYTGNTYFRYPALRWPGTFRPFAEYESHLDIIVLYTLNEDTQSRVEDLEIIVQPAWHIASKQRSSTTREYIGAVVDIDDLRHGRGEFQTPEEFYAYWRKYGFKVGKVVQQQLDKMLKG